MPISGLVIVLDGRDGSTARVVESIRNDRRFSIGSTEARGRLPVVLETAGAPECREALHWVKSLPGVAMVQVVHVDFSDTPAPGRQGKEDPRHGC